MSALQNIRQLDYTVLFAQDIARLRHFYEAVLRFPVHRELGSQWVELRVGSTILALTERGLMFDEPLRPRNTLAVQLAFRVAPDDVAACEAELRAAGVAIERPTTDQPWKHRTLFFRDPDNNVVEIFAEL